MRRLNLIGQKYGRLIVVREIEQIGTKRRFWCKCDCGKEIPVLMDSLRSGNTKSCGCFNKEQSSLNNMTKNIVDESFGSLVVVERADKKSKFNKAFWLCECDCGGTRVVDTNNLTSGRVTDCGRTCPYHVKKKSARPKSKRRERMAVCRNCKRLFKSTYGRTTCSDECRRILKNKYYQQRRKGDTNDSEEQHIPDVKIGGKYGLLTVTAQHTEKLRNETAWVCECDCGNQTFATTGQLVYSRKKSCGCLRKKTPANALDLAGKKFGKLTVIERAGATNSGTALWRCECKCGNPFIANATQLRRGDTVSCGCAKPEQIRKAREALAADYTIDGVQVPLLMRKARSDSGTGHKGVHERVRRGKTCYEASITVKGKRKYAGPFAKLEDAIAARKRLEDEYHAPYIKALKERKDSDDK